MLRHDIHPIRRQQIFGLLLHLLHLGLVMVFAFAMPDNLSLWFVIIMELIEFPGYSSILIISKEYRLNDNYPYLLAMKFYSENRLSRKIMDELGKYGVLFKYEDNEWKVCQPINNPV